MLLILFASCTGSGDTTGNPDATMPSGVTSESPGVSDTPSSTAQTAGGNDVTDDPEQTTGNEGRFGLPEVMPVINIDTYDVPISSKEVYIGGLLSLTETEEQYALDNVTIEIRGRGNYSWHNTEKKSYRVKFAEKVNVLGQGNGPARSWTLLAVHCDQSMLRNAAAFDFASKLSGLTYVSSASFVKLYLNGDYQGVYQLSEQMQVQEYRVNVNDQGEQEDTGFLVELDAYASENVISDGYGNQYEIKSDVWNIEQRIFIQDYMMAAFYSVLEGDREEIEELIDIDSVVDAYIVEEVFKNLDAGWSSFYMYRDIGGKLFFGPVWDFDLTSGNADGNDMNPNFPSYKYLYAGSDYFGYYQEHKWFVQLMKYDWFVDLVRQRWGEITEALEELPEYVRYVADLYSDEFDENFERWPIFGQKINREPVQVQALSSHDEHAEYLAVWLENRVDWLTDYFNGEVPAEPQPGDHDYEFSGGEGTKESPFIIASEKDFYDFTIAMLTGIKFSGEYFIQSKDLDMSSYPGYNGIGAAGTFDGVYNGNGHTIKVDIRGNDEAPFPYVSGTIMNVFTTGSVTNNAQASGIARSVRVNGVLLNCGSDVKVVSTGQNAGGIASSNQSGGGAIIGCWFAGTVEAAQTSGAINVYIEGRGGEFTGNFYLDSSAGDSVGEEISLTEDVLVSSLADKLNAALGDYGRYSQGIGLCSWKATQSLPVMVSG